MRRSHRGREFVDPVPSNPFWTLEKANDSRSAVRSLIRLQVLVRTGRPDPGDLPPMVVPVLMRELDSL